MTNRDCISDAVMRRVRSGCHIEWHGDHFYVFDHLDLMCGAYQDPRAAFAKYRICCGDGDPIPQFRDVLPLTWGEDEVAVVDNEHAPALYDGIPRNP